VSWESNPGSSSSSSPTN